MNSIVDNRLRSAERIRKSSEFAKVFENQSKKISNRLLRLHIAKNNLPVTRLGVSVGKRVGHAVMRNAVKRRLREAFRKKKADLPAGFDIVCVASPRIANSLGSVAESLNELLTRALPTKNQR